MAKREGEAASLGQRRLFSSARPSTGGITRPREDLDLYEDDYDDVEEDDKDAQDYEHEIGAWIDEEERYNSRLDELLDAEDPELLEDDDIDAIRDLAASDEPLPDPLDDDPDGRPSTRPREPGKEYDQWCWGEHHLPLSDKTNRRCQECGWLKCTCGHCWCDMPRRMKAMPPRHPYPYGVQHWRIDGAVRCHACHGRPYRPCQQCNGAEAGCPACTAGVTCCPECNGKGLFKTIAF